jgi:hypothetical protein
MFEDLSEGDEYINTRYNEFSPNAMRDQQINQYIKGLRKMTSTP